MTRKKHLQPPEINSALRVAPHGPHYCAHRSFSRTVSNMPAIEADAGRTPAAAPPAQRLVVATAIPRRGPPFPSCGRRGRGGGTRGRFPAPPEAALSGRALRQLRRSVPLVSPLRAEGWPVWVRAGSGDVAARPPGAESFLIGNRLRPEGSAGVLRPGSGSTPERRWASLILLLSLIWTIKTN